MRWGKGDMVGKGTTQYRNRGNEEVEVNAVSEICENAMRKGRWGPLNEFFKSGQVKTSLSQ